MDAVIEEVRRIRDELVAEYGYDLHALSEWLRQREKESRDRLADPD